MSDVMRQEYRELSDHEKVQMRNLKKYGLDLHEFVAGFGESREISLAKTKIEEAVMWAVKHITR